MSEIYIDIREVWHVNYELPRLEERVSAIQNRTRQLEQNMPDEVLEKYQIGERLMMVRQDMGKWKEKVKELFEVTKSCMEYYAETESENEKNADMLLQLFDSNIV